MLTKTMLSGALLAMGLAGAARGDDATAVPTLGDLKIVLIDGLDRFERIDLPALTPSRCATTSTTDELHIQECILAPAVHVDVRLSDGGTTGFSLEKLTYFDQQVTQGVRRREYHYAGPWTRTVDGVTLTSTARLVVAASTSAPANIRGFLQLDDYDKKWPLQAQPASTP